MKTLKGLSGKVSHWLTRWLCSLTGDSIFYQVRLQDRTKWISRDEWFQLLKQNQIKHTHGVREVVKGKQYDQ